MSLTFNGRALFGTNHAANVMPPGLQVVRTKFVGVSGESEIRCGVGGRPISYYMWIFDSGSLKSMQSVLDYLDVLDGLVSVNGKLLEKGNMTRTFSDCTFMGFDRSGLLQGNVIKDFAGTLGGGYFTDGVLNWYQNSIAS